MQSSTDPKHLLPPLETLYAFKKARLFGGMYAGLLVIFFTPLLFENAAETLAWAFIFLSIPALILLATSTAWVSRGLVEWHFANVPTDQVPATPNAARVFTGIWVRRLAMVFLALAALAVLLGWMKMKLSFVAGVLTVSVLFYLVAMWLALPNARTSRDAYENLRATAYRVRRRARRRL